MATSRHDILSSPQRKKRKRRRILFKVALSFLALVLLIGCMSWFAHQDYTRIADIEIEGNKVISSEEISKIAHEEISGKYAWLFPKNNIFIYPKNHLIQKLSDEFSRFSEVDITIVESDLIKVSVAERSPYALWCGEEYSGEPRDVLGKCYFLDDTGYIFTIAPPISENVYFEFYGPVLLPEGGNVETASSTNYVLENYSPLRASILSDGQFERFIEFKKSLEKLGIESTRLSILLDGDLELFMLSEGKILFNESQDYNKLADDLRLSLDIKLVDGAGGRSILDIEYIDMRFDDRAVFKFIE